MKGTQSVGSRRACSTARRDCPARRREPMRMTFMGGPRLCGSAGQDRVGMGGRARRWEAAASRADWSSGRCPSTASAGMRSKSTWLVGDAGLKQVVRSARKKLKDEHCSESIVLSLSEQGAWRRWEKRRVRPNRRGEHEMQEHCKFTVTATSLTHRVLTSWIQGLEGETGCEGVISSCEAQSDPTMLG